MKNLIKPILFVLLTATASLAETNDVKVPAKLQVSVYNVQNSYTLKLFVEKQIGETVKVELKNKAGVLLQTEYISKGVSKSGMNIDLSQLEKGTYSVEISTKSEKIVKEINITNTSQITEKIELL
jgi:hypothetical protein